MGGKVDGDRTEKGRGRKHSPVGGPTLGFGWILTLVPGHATLIQDVQICTSNFVDPSSLIGLPESYVRGQASHGEPQLFPTLHAMQCRPASLPVPHRLG